MPVTWWCGFRELTVPNDGKLQIDVPWAREGADFTFLFESFAMTLVREMPVNKVSKIIKVDDNKLCGG